MKIVRGDFTNPRIIALLRTHIESARAETAAGSAHALDLSGLQAPDIAFWSIHDGDDLLGIGALKRLTGDEGEVKSMHTVQTRRRSGAGGAMLRHIIAEARSAGLKRLSLETGSWEYFKPAHALYAKHGFVPCPPFGAYAPDPNSLFMTLELPSPT